MKENKGKKRLQGFVVWLLTLVWAVGFSCLGICCRPYISWAVTGYVCFVAVLVLLCAGSLLADFWFNRYLTKTSVQNAHDEIERRRLRMLKDEKRERRRLDRVCTLAVGYLAALAAALSGVCFFCGATGITMIVGPLVCMYLMRGLVSRLWYMNGRKADVSGALSPEEYPLLYALAREAAGLAQDAPLYIFPGDYLQDEECNAGIGQQNGAVLLCLGPVLLNITTPEELKQIVRHEAAHIAQEHVHEKRSYFRLMDYLTGEGSDNPFDLLSAFVLRFFATYVLYEGKYYFRLSGAAKEARADLQAAGEGDRLAQASALAKLQAYDYYTFEQESHFNLYESETMPQHMITDLIAHFREQLVSRETDWRRMLENEIPSRSASHPTFRQRWEALGCCAYTLEPACNAGDYARECRAVAEEADRRIADVEETKYTELRKADYLDYLDTVKAYEQNPTELSPEESRPVVLAYYRIGMPEKAEEICDRQLAASDNAFNTHFARYWKGVNMLHRYDHRGLAYIYEAMDTNRNYIEDGLSLIGHYCTMMGLEAELEEYRSRVVGYVQENEDHSRVGIHSRANLSAETLPEGWQQKILNHILATANGGVTHVYLVHETVNDEYTPSSFVLRYREGLPAEECDRIYMSVFRLLDDWPEGWEFCLYDYEPAMGKPLAKVPGSCIYHAE